MAWIRVIPGSRLPCRLRSCEPASLGDPQEAEGRVQLLELSKLAAALGVSKDAVHRVWKEAGLKPHRLERYMASDDPDFEAKAADIIGLYLNPPSMRRCFVSMRRLPFRLWTGSIRSCRFRRARRAPRI